MNKGPDPSTVAARAGLGRGASGEGDDLVPPLSLASVRAYPDLAAVDAGMDTRDSYRRYGGGVPAVLETALAELETVRGGAAPSARVTASGQAALLLATLMFATSARRRVVVVRPCYGGTESLFTGPLAGLGVSLTTVDLPLDDGASHGGLVAAAMDSDVAMVVAEVIVNPLMKVVDVPAVAAACRGAGAACVVDATLSTPFLFQPFAWGADAVFHSLTKFLGGHSDVLGGVLLLRADHESGEWLDAFARLAGLGLSPFDSWLTLRGLRTAGLRVERSSENAAALARWFADRPEVAAVHYPGVHGACDEERAARLLAKGRGPMLSIDVRGGKAAADAFVRGLSGVRLAPSLGDVATTVSHPALTSHRAWSREQREALGIGEALIRISSGVEALDDLCAEFSAALEAAAAV